MPQWLTEFVAFIAAILLAVAFAIVISGRQAQSQTTTQTSLTQVVAHAPTIRVAIHA